MTAGRSRQLWPVALAAAACVACSPIAPTPTPAPPVDAPQLRESPRPELPPNPEPTYVAYLSIWSTVIRHPPIATLALDATAPIVAYARADPPAVRFTWNFDDGAGGRFTSTADRVEYLYRSRGWKTINVTIEDARGRRAANSTQVLMLDYPREWAGVVFGAGAGAQLRRVVIARRPTSTPGRAS